MSGGGGGGKFCHACLFGAFVEGAYDFLKFVMCFLPLVGVSCLWCSVFVRLSISRLLSYRIIEFLEFGWGDGAYW